MPTWCSIQKYQGDVQGESIRQLLYSRKVAFRLDRVDSSTQLPRPPFVLHDDSRRASVRGNNISSVRSMDRRPPSDSERSVEKGKPAESVRAEIVGPRDIGRPVSWDVEDGQLDDIAAQQNSARSSARQGTMSQAELRYVTACVSLQRHTEREPFCNTDRQTISLDSRNTTKTRIRGSTDIWMELLRRISHGWNGIVNTC